MLGNKFCETIKVLSSLCLHFINFLLVYRANFNKLQFSVIEENNTNQDLNDCECKGFINIPKLHGRQCYKTINGFELIMLLF